MSSKTYKRKNTKSKNKKKTIKTLKKINIKRNNRRSKMRSNIRKIRGGGSIKWNITTGFEGKEIRITDIDMLKGKPIKFQIQSEEHINRINQAIKFDPLTPIPDISNKTLIEGTLTKIEIFREYKLLYIEFTFKDGNKRHVGVNREFIVCNQNVVCKKNDDLSMFEIEGIEGIEENKHNNNNLQYIQVGTQNPNIQPNINQLNIQPNIQPNNNNQPNNIQPNNNNIQPNANNNLLSGVDLTMFKPAKKINNT